MGWRRSLCSWYVAFASISAIVAAGPAEASIISINTSAESGATARFEFDLIDGALGSSQASVTNVLVDGIVAWAGQSLRDYSFFNATSSLITLGNILSFEVNLGAYVGPVAGEAPDAASAFILDVSTGLPLIHTDDPTGSDALFRWDIGIAEGPAVFSPAILSDLPTPIPEPGSFLLLGLGVLTASLVRRGIGRASVSFCGILK